MDSVFKDFQNLKNICYRAEVLKHRYVSESPGGLTKTQIAVSHSVCLGGAGDVAFLASPHPWGS